MRRHLVATAAAAAWCLIAAPAFAAGVDGTYNIKGWNPGKPVTGAPNYAGTLTLTTVNGLVKARWTTGASKAVTDGVGMLKEVGGQKLLALSYIESGHPSIAVYKVSADGKRLDGEWGAQGVGHEVGTR